MIKLLPSTRRHFLHTAAASLTTLSLGPLALAAEKSAGPRWPIGCLNRPWVNWSVDEMLDGVKASGYKLVGLQTATKSDVFVGATAGPEYLKILKEKVAARGLEMNVGRLRTSEAKPTAEATTEIRRQFDNARTLGLTVLINTGAAKPETYEAWYRLMAFAAAYGADNGIQLVTKPHGGVNAASAELLICLEKINHPNLGIWYDAGNLIYYTGKDPLVEMEPIISHVTAFTAKDCAGKGAEVMTQLGTGTVDFLAHFRRLEKAGFNGPIMLEGCAVGTTAAETTANARANREFLERTLAEV